jgi:hypothetical protein
LAEAVAPDLVVVSGDVTQRAGPPSSRQRRPSWRLPDCPRLVVPGNHDLPLFDLCRASCAPTAASGAVSAMSGAAGRLPDLLVVGVDSTRRWRHRHGEFLRRRSTR